MICFNIFVLSFVRPSTNTFQSTEVATGGVLLKKLLLKILKYSQESTCVEVSFLIKWQV